MEGLKIELEPNILPRLMSDKRIYNFQIPRTTLMKVGQIGPTFLVPGKTVNFLEVSSEVRKGPSNMKSGQI